MSDSKDAERLQRLEDEVVKLRALVSAMCSKIEKLEQQRPERCDNCDGSGLVSHKMTSLYCDDCGGRGIVVKEKPVEEHK